MTASAAVDHILVAETDPLVGNHRLHGQPVFPGMAYIDLIVQLFVDDGVSIDRVRIEGLSIFNPLVVGADQDVQLTVERALRNGRWALEITGRVSRGGRLDAETTRYASAEVECAGPWPRGERVDLTAILAAATRTYDLEESYAQCRALGLEHRGYMRASGRVFESPDGVLVEVRLAADAEASASDFLCHPALLDAAAVGCGGLFTPRDAGASELLLPLHFEHFVAARRIPSSGFVRIPRASQVRAGELTRQTLEVLDREGQRVAALEGYVNKLVRRRIGAPAAGRREGRALASGLDASSVTAPAAVPGLKDRLRALFAAQLGLPESAIKPDAGYYEMGLDSQALLSLVEKIGGLVGRPLSPTLLFEQTSLDALAEHLGAVSGAPPEPRDGPRALEAHVTVDDAIAIVGLAGRYPGADNVEELWNNLALGKDCIREVPRERWDSSALDGITSPSGKPMSRWGGFLSEVDRFDSLFFNIAPGEAERMDPQERLFLETCWEAIEDAGYTPKTLAMPRGPSRRQDVGVFVGVMHNDYSLLAWEALSEKQPFALPINQAPLANRVSYVMNFHGPSLVVDTVCSSSLTAVHLAVESLRRGECEVAIAGGVNLSLHPSKYITYGVMDMHSSDGRCRSFGAGGDGYVSAEGVGAVVLKPRARAIADGDHIYAIIRGSAINHGGKASGFTVPSPVAHADMIAACLAKAGVDARSIDYVEAHGTGTSLGDPIEIQGLVNAFERFTTDTQFCAIGSVKSNIGHAEAAAGISGLSKVLLQLRHRQFAPSLHAEQGNPHIDFSRTPFRLQQALAPWPAPVAEAGGTASRPRRAALSSFGAYGSNAHMILEEDVPAPVADEAVETPRAVVVLSAHDRERLLTYARKLLSFVRCDAARGSELVLADVAYTLQVGREAMRARAGFLVSSLGELSEKLERFVEGAAAEEPRSATALTKEDEALVAWLRGEQVDWRTLHRSTKRRRVSLPTYPFARARHWISGGRRGLLHRAPAAAESASTPVVMRPRWCAEELPEGGDTSDVRHEIVFLEGTDLAAAVGELAAREGTRCGRTVISARGDDAAVRFGAYARALLAKLQEEAKLGTRGRILLQVVCTRPADGWITSGLAGALRTATREDPRLSTQLVSFAEGTSADACWRALARNRTVKGHATIRHGEGRREVLRWEEVGDVGVAPPPWRSRGIYLITGGAGGIGRLVAEDIARGGEGRVVVLAGRSPGSVALDAALRRMSENGARVLYKRADVSDAQDVLALVHGIRSELGALHGVIHAAGVNRDAFLIKKSWPEVERVIAPKVAGTIHLDRATADVDLDFFALFSSVAGALGNAGQVDYAAANGFMDGFASHREELRARGERRGRTVSIDWPLWQDAGMTVDSATLDDLRDTLGMVPMRTENGLSTLHRALAGGSSQILVIEGDRARILGAVTNRPPVAESPAAAPPLAAESPAAAPPPEERAPAIDAEAEALRELARAKLRRLIGDAVKVPPEQMETDATWERYGIDSLIVTRLNRELARSFRDLPKTIFFEHQTIDALARHFVEEHEEAARAWCGLAPIAERVPVASRAPIAERVPAASCEPAASHMPGAEPSRARVAATPGARDPIAIIGLSGRYPFAPHLEAYWQNLAAGRDCIGEIPAERWPLEGFFFADPDEAVARGGSYSKWGGFLGEFAEFDPAFFGISPKEVMAMDPQERHFLQSSWEALEDAGYTRSRLHEQHGGRVGVFAGITKAGFNLWGAELRREGRLLHPRTSFSSVANRVSYFLSLSGPSVPIDTMCSSSLTAIHEARESLLRGECEVAIAGGVNMYLHPATYAELCALRMLSVDGRCRSFGAGGKGFVPGEGVGVAVLKPLSAALRDGDSVHAVILATHINHGGKTSGYTVPNPHAQAELVIEALRRADVDPRTIGYVEAHGTGTELGDPIEVRALTQAFRTFTQETQYCAIGSAKSNIGHLEAAAGIAGLSKVVLQMQHGAIAPSLHADPVNPNIEFETTPFRLSRELSPWDRVRVDGVELPRRAGVSSFGAGGANAHVVVEEFSPDVIGALEADVGPSRPAAVVLSARTLEQLEAQAKNLLGWVRARRKEGREPRLEDVAFTLQVGREAMEERMGLLVASVDALDAALSGVLAGESMDGIVFRGDARRNRDTASLFADDDASDLVRTWLDRDKMSKVLAAWVRGVSVPWRRLYEGRPTPRIVRLPTYAFARQRFWLRDDHGVSAEVLRSVAMANHVPAPTTAAPSRGASAPREAPLSKPHGVGLRARAWAPEGTTTSAPVPELASRAQSVPLGTDDPPAPSSAAYRETLDATLARLTSAARGDGACITIELDVPGAPRSRAELEALLEAGRAIVSAPLPVVATLRGSVSTSAVFLASCSDILLAGEDCRVEYHPSTLAPWIDRDRQRALLAQCFGDAAAERWLAPAAPAESAALDALGLDRVPVAELEPRRRALVASLEAKERAALRQLKSHLARHVWSLLGAGPGPATGPYRAPSATPTGGGDVAAFFAGRLAPSPDEREDGEGWPVPLDSEVVSLREYEDGALVIRMHDRQSKNTFSDAFVSGLLAAFAFVAQAPRIKVVILTGYEQYFACGGTREGLEGIYNSTITYKDKPIYDLALKCEVPVIAAMQGHGLGVGWTLGLFADLPIFSQESVYSCSMMKYGFTPGGGSTFILPHRLGANLGREAQLTAMEYKGHELERRGIRFPVLPRSEVVAYARGVARRLCRASREELARAKGEAVREIREQIEIVYERELEMHAQNFIGNDRVLARIASEFNPGAPTPATPEQAAPARAPEAPPTVSMDGIKNVLRAALAEELFLKPEDIDDDRPFMELGLDSITSVNWGKRINAHFDLQLPATKVYEFPCLRRFAELVAAERRVRGAAVVPAVSTPPSPTPPPPRAEPAAPSAPPRSARRAESSPRVQPVRPERDRASPPEAIAVVGAAGRFPGAGDLDAFWRLIRQKEDAVTEVSSARWTREAASAREPAGSDAGRYRWMGALDGVDRFDPLFFQITPAEAGLMDPQQRIFLEQAWACCEDAGYAPAALAKGKCGVFVGTARNDYGQDHPAMRSAQGLLGANSAVLAARIAYRLDLKGPALAIDTACSSSLVAIATACSSLAAGECDAALAGGVWVMAGPDLHIMAADAGMLSARGRCFTFDERADGYVPGEGVGVLLLKRVSDALRDGDHMYGVIRGWGTNQDGRSNGLTAPNVKAQVSLQREVYQRFGVDPGQIQLVEAHGTGTKLGDPIEIDALTQSFRDHTERSGSCALGSVKSNVGHLLTAAGVASVLKVLLAIKHEELPPTANFENLNPHIRLQGTPFYINTELRPWVVAPGERRRAAVNSFGVSGTNAHLVIEEPPSAPAADTTEAGGEVLAVLSAREPAQLREYAARLADAVTNARLSLADIAYTLQVGREAMDERFAVVVSSRGALQRELEALARGEAAACARARRGGSEEDEAAVARALEAGDLRSVARLWLGGARVTWEVLYRGRAPRRRVSLPTYPFARETYWLPSIPAEGDDAATPARAAAPHPLIDEDRGTPAAPAYAKRFARSDFFLRDHVIGGEYVLPGVVHLEMALAAAEVATGAKVVAITHVIWGRKVIVGEDGLEVVVRLARTAPNVFDYQIVAEGDGESTPYSQGTLELAPHRVPAPGPAHPSLDAIRERCAVIKEKEELYPRLAAEGFYFGPSFRLTEELRCGEREALARVVISADGEDPRYTLHPAMLDASLRSFLGIVGRGKTDLELRIPFSLESIRISGATPRACHAYATVNRVGADGELSADIAIVNDAGAEVIRVTGLVAKRREPRAAREATAAPRLPAIAAEASIYESAVAYIKERVAEVTRIAPSKLRAHVPFEQYGIDSIVIMKLTRAMSAGFGALSGTLLFEHGTIDALARHLMAEHGARLRELVGARTSANPAPEGVPQARAVEARGQWVQAPATTSGALDDGIAIVGLAGRYPQADGVEELWRNLSTGRDCIEEIPRARWDYRPYYDPERKPGRIHGRWGGFLRNVDEFDADFFAMTPEDAALTDPQVRLFLQCAWHAVEDAGYTPAGLCPDAERRVGVFAAVMWNEYPLLGKGSRVALTNNAFLANRVSYHFDFRGPSTVVDTGCSSSLQAIAMACASVRAGESHVAVVGGVNLSLHPNKYISLSRANLLSSDGRCRSYGKGGDGQVPGEGVGCVVLKPLARAVADGDHVYGVIRAAVTNHGGKGGGPMVPNLNAQAELVARAIAESGIAPDHITYLEGHGTGTELGDAIEVRALTKAFGDRHAAPSVPLASIKSNLGHLEGASGIAALTKVLLQMRYGQIAPSLHSREPNPQIDLARARFRVPQRLEEWPRPRLSSGDGGEVEVGRVAGIGSFGAGGANAYVIVQEHVVAPPAVRPADPLPAMVVLSARTREALRTAARALADHVSRNPGVDLRDLAFTLQVGRVAMGTRFAALARTARELAWRLEEFLADRLEAPETAYGVSPDEPPDGMPTPVTVFDARDCATVIAAWAAGANLAWDSLYHGAEVRRLSLPVYPFERTRHWITALERDDGHTSTRAAALGKDEVDEILARVQRRALPVEEAVKLLGARFGCSSSKRNGSLRA